VRIFAISDIHLSGEKVTKPMDKFESFTSGYIDEVKANWDSVIEDDDVVLICGDISWASSLDEARYDLDLIGELKGIKVIIRGNHDYWWRSVSKIRSALSNDTYALQNDSIKIGNTVICGTRGWTASEPSEKATEENVKIYKREIERLKLSLNDAKEKRNEEDSLICMTHFPPFNSRMEDNDFVSLFKEYKVNKVVYGHLHGSNIETPLYFEKDGIEYYLTSCDLTHNKLIQVL
jgi:predicted phosphohydrolase